MQPLVMQPTTMVVSTPCLVRKAVTGVWKKIEGAGLLQDVVVVGVGGAGLHLGAGVAFEEVLPHRRDLPVGHVALGVIGGIAVGDRHPRRAGGLEHPCGVLHGAMHQRAATHGKARLGEPRLQIDHEDARPLAEADLHRAVTDVLVSVVAHRALLRCRRTPAVQAVTTAAPMP